MAHEWTIVRLGGTHYHCDVTFQLEVPNNLQFFADRHNGIVFREQKIYMLPVLRLVYGIGILDSPVVQEEFLFIRKEYKTDRRREAFQFLDSPFRGIPVNGIALGLFQT